MKFTIQREALLKPLTHVSGVVERRHTLPVLANLLVSARQGELHFTGTDLEVELVARVNADVDGESEVTLPARKLLDICKALPDGATVQVDANSEKATLTAGKSRFVLATLPATDFPVIDDVEVVQSVQIAPSELKRLMDRTQFAMANQDVRYYLNGLLLEFFEGGIRTVATDGHRLAVAETEASTALSEPRQLIIPRKGIGELHRLLGDANDDLTLEMGRSHVRVRLADTVFTSKLIDGRFPDYQSVIPVGADHELHIDREAFRSALQRAAILSNEKYRGVKLEIEPGQMRIVAHNPEQEEAVEEIEVEGADTKLAVGFNVNYLLEAINVLDGETIALKLKDANSSCLLKLPDSESNLHVVMPLRL